MVQDVDVVGDHQSPSFLSRADAEIVFFAVTGAESLFVEDADCLERFLANQHTKPVYEPKLDPAAGCARSNQTRHILDVHTLGKLVPGPGIAVEYFGNGLPGSS